MKISETKSSPEAIKEKKTTLQFFSQTENQAGGSRNLQQHIQLVTHRTGTVKRLVRHDSDKGADLH